MWQRNSQGCAAQPFAKPSERPGDHASNNTEDFLRGSSVPHGLPESNQGVSRDFRVAFSPGGKNRKESASEQCMGVVLSNGEDLRVIHKLRPKSRDNYLGRDTPRWDRGHKSKEACWVPRLLARSRWTELPGSAPFHSKPGGPLSSYFTPPISTST